MGRAGGRVGGPVGGRASGNKNEPQALGSPKLVQWFTPTPSEILPEMVSLATFGRQHGRHSDFTLRRHSHKRFCRISPNLIGLAYIPSDIFPQNMTSSTTSVREPSPSLFCELRRAVYSPPRRRALVFKGVILSCKQMSISL